MDLQIKVGERITQLRKGKGLSQQQFSYDAEMERTYLSHIEKGRKNISLATLEKILNALDVSAQEFFNTKDFKQK